MRIIALATAAGLFTGIAVAQQTTNARRTRLRHHSTRPQTRVIIRPSPLPRMRTIAPRPPRARTASRRVKPKTGSPNVATPTLPTSRRTTTACGAAPPSMAVAWCRSGLISMSGRHDKLAPYQGCMIATLMQQQSCTIWKRLISPRWQEPVQGRSLVAWSALLPALE
jgi:hypothetical protein